eukprot:1704419-Amphidinium_carterae.1
MLRTSTEPVDFAQPVRTWLRPFSWTRRSTWTQTPKPQTKAASNPRTEHEIDRDEQVTSSEQLEVADEAHRFQHELYQTFQTQCPNNKKQCEA